MKGYFLNRLKNLMGVSLSIAKTEFKLKNEGTWLGVFWYLLAPLITFIFLLGIFQNRLGADILNYPLYLFLGIMIFDYFQKITDESIATIRSNSGIIKSINFQKESLIGSIVLKTLFSHIFEIIILFGFLLYFGISIHTMIFYPLILILISIFSIGAGLILAALGTYFFDLKNIWGFGIKLVWLATPVFYSIEFGTKLFYFNLINPMFYFITLARDLIIYVKIPETWIILGAFSYSLLFLFMGLFLFDRLKNKFAELI